MSILTKISRFQYYKNIDGNINKIFMLMSIFEKKNYKAIFLKK